MIAIEKAESQGGGGSVLAVSDPGYDLEISSELADGQLIYVARYPELPRVFSQGTTVYEALANLGEVLSEYLADMAKAGVAVPDKRPSPRITILTIVADETVVSSEAQSIGANWRVIAGGG